MSRKYKSGPTSGTLSSASAENGTSLNSSLNSFNTFIPLLEAAVASLRASFSSSSSSSDRPARPLPHSPALPSISAHSSPPDISQLSFSSPIHFPHPHQRPAFQDGSGSAGLGAVSSVSLTSAPASSSPLHSSRHPRPCFAALPSVEKSQSTQALVHVHPLPVASVCDGSMGNERDRTKEASKSHVAGKSTTQFKMNESQPVLSLGEDLELDSLENSLIKGKHSCD